MKQTVRKRQLERRPRRSGKHAQSRHLKVMPPWIAFGAATILGVVRSIARSNGRYREAAMSWALAGASAAATGLILGSIEVRRPRCERIRIPIAGLPAPFDDLTIAVIGDFHFRGDYRRANLRQARCWIDEARPDLIVMTGDFVDHLDDLPLLIEELRGIRAPLGVFAVLGNHDYWFDPAAIERALEDLGVRLLVNEHQIIELSGEALVLAGVDDPWYGDADLEATLADAPLPAPVILLAHAPDYIERAARAGVSLQISGHSHAGHVAMPLLGPAVLPMGALRYYRGLYRYQQTWLYVNRGLGGRPLRINASPELTLLRLEAARTLSQ
ncbi:MAG: metallophosphoesterase [Herpetosiphonaceae bacterium]|nr:MAG: metallophosphoesterase [Herpetosiphonaceae bacterium]